MNKHDSTLISRWIMYTEEGGRGETGNGLVGFWERGEGGKDACKWAKSWMNEKGGVFDDLI